MNSKLRPSRVEIDLNALRHNIGIIRSLLKPGARFMAVVKADAYGHGAVDVARTAEQNGADFLGVALLEEADIIRESGVKLPIVILYPETIERTIEAANRGYCVSLSSVDDLTRLKQEIGENSGSLKYFIKINSGMNRYGIDADSEQANSIAEHVSSYDGLMGFNTNLADPLTTKEDLANRQMEEFFAFMRNAMKYSNNGLLYSYEASGSLWDRGFAEGSLVRVGLLMYGIAPDESKRLDLKPVMSVKSRISEIHQLECGEGVGYGFSFVAERPSKVAVVPMGYADGYPWALSNIGSVIIHEKMAPVIGRVCMDAFMIDVSEVDDVSVGDEVVVMGSQGELNVDANTLGRWANSFAYEIVSGWSKRLPRVIL